MAKGEREGWEIPLHPLSLDEFGASSSSSLLESLADEPVTTDPTSAKGNLSSLSINPERVAKVIAIGEFSWAKRNHPKSQVVPDRIFSVALHPGGEKLVAAAGDKWGKVLRISTTNNSIPRNQLIK